MVSDVVRAVYKRYFLGRSMLAHGMLCYLTAWSKAFCCPWDDTQWLQQSDPKYFLLESYSFVQKGLQCLQVFRSLHRCQESQPVTFFLSGQAFCCFVSEYQHLHDIWHDMVIYDMISTCQRQNSQPNCPNPQNPLWSAREKERDVSGVCDRFVSTALTAGW